MPITINGNGSVTGISVGGLPDGIVDTDMIANNAVTNAKSTITGGKVLNVVQSTYNTQVTVDSATFTDTGLSASITPSATSSKIMVLVSQTFYNERAHREAFSGIQLLRGSTVIATESEKSNGSYMYINTGSSFNWNHGGRWTLQYLDSPNTTSSTTYKTQGRPHTTNNSGLVRFQYDSAVPSYITLMEIAG